MSAKSLRRSTSTSLAIRGMAASPSVSSSGRALDHFDDESETPDALRRASLAQRRPCLYLFRPLTFDFFLRP